MHTRCSSILLTNLSSEPCDATLQRCARDVWLTHCWTCPKPCTESQPKPASPPNSPSWLSPLASAPQVGDFTLAQLRALRWPSGDGVMTVEEAVLATSQSVSRVTLVRDRARVRACAACVAYVYM